MSGEAWAECRDSEFFEHYCPDTEWSINKLKKDISALDIGGNKRVTSLKKLSARRK